MECRLGRRIVCKKHRRSLRFRGIDCEICFKIGDANSIHWQLANLFLLRDREFQPCAEHNQGSDCTMLQFCLYDRIKHLMKEFVRGEIRHLFCFVRLYRSNLLTVAVSPRLHLGLILGIESKNGYLYTVI